MQDPLFSDKNTARQNVQRDFRGRTSHEAILNASGLAIVYASAKGIICGMSPAATHLLGYAPDEAKGRPWTDLHSDQEVAQRVKRFANVEDHAKTPFETIVLSGNQNASTRGDWTFIKKDNSTFRGSLVMVALPDSGDGPAFAGIIKDVSELEKLRADAEVSEQKFRLLAENIAGAIYLCLNDDLFTVIYLNDHIRDITGYSKEDFYSGKINFSMLFHPDDKEAVFKKINESVAARKNFHLQYRMRHASGSWRWVDETGVGVFQDDKLTMLEGFLYDITQQKEAEQKLHRIAEENLRFFNNPVNLNAVADFNGFLQRISPSWMTMLGWTERELKAKPVMEFVHPEDVARTREALRFISRSKKVHTFENRFSCKDGTYRWLLWGSASDADTRMIYASAIDISARKKSEENILDSKSNLESITTQLQEQNRRLDEFAHIISHNLRAPVNNIQALINLLNDESAIDDYKLIFEKLKNVSKNLRETMNELMDTLKARSQPQVDLAEVRFKEVLDKVVQSLEGELIVAEASVTFDFNDVPGTLYSKPYLESIFQNLLTNAIKYRSPHRKPAIHFQSRLEDNHIELRVSDNGQGIDMEKFGDKLFGLHKTFHDHHEARGVGLFLVKTQIESLGGSISVSSEVDKGTTFTIRLN